MAEAGTKVSLDQKIQVVRDAFAAFSRGDMKALSDAWTDDFVWHSRGSVFGGDFMAKEAAIGANARHPQQREDLTLAFHDIRASAKHTLNSSRYERVPASLLSSTFCRKRARAIWIPSSGSASKTQNSSPPVRATRSDLRKVAVRI